MNAIIGINIKAAIFGSNSNTSTNKGSRTKFIKKGWNNLNPINYCIEYEYEKSNESHGI